MSFDNS
jgi:ADP-ribose pyrophosphatase YjhB (NUDIX family)